MADGRAERDQQAAEQFVKETLTALEHSTCDRAPMALAFVEVTGALMRKDLLEQPTRLGLYARTLQLLTDHVLDSVLNPREVRH